MKKFLLYLWQLPQNILGAIVVMFTSPIRYETHYETAILNGTAVSLGNYIIIGKTDYSLKVLKHEQGHQKQSLFLGWLYLIIIGIPSFVGNIVDRIHPIDYYNQPWEKWADKLGGVER